MLAVRAQNAAQRFQRKFRASQLQACAFSWDAWFERERAAENVYFNKQDDLALRKLLHKLKGEADYVDMKAKRQQEMKEKLALADIPGLKLDTQQVLALLQWKHDMHH